MKKIIAIIIALVLMSVCCACAGQNDDPICGGWNEAEDTTITEELKEIFDKGTADYTGVDLEPISLVATQVVAGTNYKFLCNGTIMTTEPVSKLYEDVIYKDLKDNCTMSSINEVEGPMVGYNKSPVTAD